MDLSQSPEMGYQENTGERGRRRVDIQRTARAPAGKSSWRGPYLRSEALRQVLLLSVLCTVLPSRWVR